MKILITGGCGFIGSNLAEYHLDRGDEVFVIDDLSTGKMENIESFKTHPRFHFEISDLLTWDGLAKKLGWAERIYHMAALVGIFHVIHEPIKVIISNTMGCQRILETLVQINHRPRVMFASTSSVYGDNTTSEVRETDSMILLPVSHPLCGYAVGKIADEVLAHTYFKKYNIPSTCVRIFNTTGPKQTGSYGMVVPRFVKQACANEPIFVHGDGLQTRSFCDVRDTIRGFNLLAEAEDSIGEAVNLGNDREISINELAQLIKDQLHSKSEIRHISYEEAYGIKFADIRRRRPILTKLKELTGFQHHYTLEQTIDDISKQFRR